jgi:hypothetical protein
MKVIVTAQFRVKFILFEVYPFYFNPLSAVCPIRRISRSEAM